MESIGKKGSLKLTTYKLFILSAYAILSTITILLGLYNLFFAVVMLSTFILGAILIFFLLGKFTTAHYLMVLFPSIILSPIIRIPGFPIAIRLDDLWMAFGAILLVIYLFKRKNLDIYFPRYARVFLLFIVWIAFTIFLSTYREPYFYSVRDWTEVYKNVKLLIYLLIAINISLNMKDLRKIVSVAIGSLLVTALFGMMQYFNFLNINSWLTPYYILDSNVRALELNGRVVGTFGNPNMFGFAILIGIALSLSELFKSFKIRHAISLFIFFIALTMTQSRTALVTGVVLLALISLMILWKTNKKVKTLALFSFIPLIGIVALRYAPHQFFSRIGRLSDVSSDSSLNARFRMWEDIYVTRTEGNELFGTGPTSLVRIMFDNEWLMLLTYYGIIGVALFIVMFALMYNKLSKVNSNNLNFYNIAARGLILVYAICMWMSDVFTLLQIMPIVMLVIGLSLNKSVNTKTEKDTHLEQIG